MLCAWVLVADVAEDVVAVQGAVQHRHQWEHPQHHRQPQCTDIPVSSALSCVNECWLLMGLSVLWLFRDLDSTGISGTIPSTISNLTKLSDL